MKSEFDGIENKVMKKLPSKETSSKENLKRKVSNGLSVSGSK